MFSKTVKLEDLFDKGLCVGDSIDFDVILVGENIDGNLSGAIEYEFKSKKLDSCDQTQTRK